MPWLLLGIGTAVALEGAARAAGAYLPRPADAVAGPAVAIAAAALAVALIALNLPAADKSGDHSAQTFVDTLFAALPENAAILSFWGPSPPLWHAQLVLGERPDVLVVDDTNIVYEGWGTREARIASLICTRPVFILPVNAGDPRPDPQALRRDPGADRPRSGRWRRPRPSTCRSTAWTRGPGPAR